MAFLYPALFPLVVDRAPDSERTHAIGTFSLFFDLSQGLGAPILGVVVALADERAAFAVSGLASLAALAVFRMSAVTSPAGGRQDAGPCAEHPPLGG
jgi:MFS family permease